MTRRKPLKLNTQISEEAAEWYVEMRTGELDAAERQQFDTWLCSSPEHLRAYLEIAAIWNERERLAERRPEDLHLDATESAYENVIHISETSRPANSADSVRTRWRRRRFVLAASIVAMVLSVGAIVWFHAERARNYVTDVGEQRLVRLADGSTVELNSRSQVRVEFSAKQRAVELVAGQALFHVAKDASRPFVVRSDTLHLRAVGTQFDVNRKRTGTVVTVIEGRVAVSGGSLPPPVEPSSPGGRGYSLTAGEQMTIQPHVAPRLVRANVAAATAWTQHQLILEPTPLSEVAEEFNRYSTRVLVVEDRGKEPLKLSGVFTTDPEFLIRYLRDRPDISIEESDSTIHITRHD